ncbi:MAG: hypothetical protein ACK42C_08355 [Aquificaceae bacterium]|jgi:hypothetical protein|nr:MAG: hypothetical protein D6804_03965 [Aquificota bacterium]
MKLVVSLLSTLLLLFADFAVAEHHHEDHELHVDCSVCILQHTQLDTPSYKPSLDIRILTIPVKFQEKPLQPVFKPLIKTTHCRAPPAL